MRASTAMSTAALAALSLTVAALAAVPATAAPAAATAAADTAPGTTAPAGFVGMAPKRVLDTRDSNQVPETRTARPLQEGQYFSTPIATGCHSHPPQECYGVVPADATAVVVNVTVTDPTADSFVTVSGTPGTPGTKPATSSINFSAGQTISNLVTVATGPVNRFVPWLTLYNNAGTAHVVLDVVGYYNPTATDKYGPLTPTRIADSRDNGTAGRLRGDEMRSYLVARPELGTADATSVILNITATEGTWDSFLTAYPTGTIRPTNGSNVNFPAGTTVSNRVVVPVGPDGRINLYNHAGWVHVIVDVVGYYGPSGKGLFSALKNPVRALDTRNGYSVATGSTVQVQAVPTDGSVPNAMGVETNITATNVLADGHLTVFPGPGQAPNTSTLNVRAARDTCNSATTAVTPEGRFSVFNHGFGLDLIADVNGYYVTG
ncbi:hypothetical protein [Kitasatospora sp. MY 5-36]|uniref:hypothetical protein n=1 Tax=Kitasatospora sp. MY 5-36 TaxID=1678027 RepID=UPI000ABF9F2B|nr:hypothetical protein [Kitasatospora sp. MY 5-36]